MSLLEMLAGSGGSAFIIPTSQQAASSNCSALAEQQRAGIKSLQEMQALQNCKMPIYPYLWSDVRGTWRGYTQEEQDFVDAMNELNAEFPGLRS